MSATRATIPGFVGAVLRAGEEGYETARVVWNAMHDRRPALIAQCVTPQDVAAAVRFALENQSMTGSTLLVDGGQHLMKFERDFSVM